MTNRSNSSRAALWTPIPQGAPGATPCNRFQHACCAHRGEVYMLGGRDKMVIRDFWKYSVVRNEWTELDCSSEWAPEELEGHSMVSYQGILYIFGGLIDSAYTDWKIPLWLFDTEKEVWRYSQGQSRPSQPVPLNRKGHSAVVLGRAMYLYGGYIDMRGSSQELWKYQFDTGVWSLLSGSQGEQGQSPGPRHGHAAAASAHQRAMYVYAGLSGLREQRDLWRWSQDSHTWSLIKTHSGPSKLVGHSMLLYRDSLLVFGGGDTLGSPGNGLWRLDLTSSSSSGGSSSSSHLWDKMAAVKGSSPPGKAHHCAVGLGPGFQPSWARCRSNSSRSAPASLLGSPRTSPSPLGKFRPFKNKLSPAPSPLLEGAIELQTLSSRTTTDSGIGSGRSRDYEVVELKGVEEEEEEVGEGEERDYFRLGGSSCLTFENQDAFRKHWNTEGERDEEGEGEGEASSDCSEESIEHHLPEAMLMIGGKPLACGKTSISVWQMAL
ncbi:kelch domain-containing protein 3 [Engraulis encrasicolus]|uniref:kelch domain-containing protein 3 n=1 Tax=Engraulis encrasicolus TaxID=184585 RepID=UPI002FCF510E